jgi:hypothetical protein
VQARADAVACNTPILSCESTLIQARSKPAKPARAGAGDAVCMSWIERFRLWEEKTPASMHQQHLDQSGHGRLGGLAHRGTHDPVALWS